MEVKMSTITITENNFQEEVAQSEIPVVLDFWASWCGPCLMMGPVFEELSEEYEEEVKFGRVDTQAEKEIADYFKIRSIPTLSIIRDGGEIERIIGFSGKENLKKMIDKALQKGKKN
jgi:thioredoxin